MRTVTNWDRYCNRIKFSQVTLPIIWNAYRDMLRGIHFQEPIKIAELGCGTAFNTQQLAKLFEVEKVTLVDFNPNVLDITRKKLSGLTCEKEFILHDLLSLDLSEKYDIVHSQGLLEHYAIEQRRQLISLHKNLLTEGGVAIILVPTPSLAYRTWRGIFEKLHMWIYTDEVAITREEFLADLEYCGLEILKMRQYHLMELGAICRRK